jgi:hypothetical protein
MLSFSQKDFWKEIVKENIESSGIFYFFEMKISKVITVVPWQLWDIFVK